MSQKKEVNERTSATSAVAEGGRSPTGATAEVAGTPPVQRWRAKRKAEVVVRLLRGEAMDALSRELGVPIPRLESWRDDALAGMEHALQPREADDPIQARLDEANRRIGELSMENELLRVRCQKQVPFPGRRSRR